MTWPNRGTTARSTVTGVHGMVASAHPLASLAGSRILQNGGNAIDAAVATAAALNVAEPYMSGLGGGGAMLIHLASGETTTLFFGGPFPAAASPETLTYATVDTGPAASTVPGSAAGWLGTLDKYGTMTAAQVFEPAIQYAEHGVALTGKNSMFYGMGRERLTDTGRQIFFPNGGASPSGTIVHQPNLARTYRTLADGGVDAFYTGPIGEEIVRGVQEAGGLMTEEDLTSVSIEWKAPSESSYRGYTVRTTPYPLTAFEIQINLNILEGFDLRLSGHNTANTIHTMVEAMKLAMTERSYYAGERSIPLPGLLSKVFAADRRKLIDLDCAASIASERGVRMFPPETIQPGSPSDFSRECTTHFDIVDEAGNAVSVTQSLGDIFGSGFLAGDTGVMMNNYLYYFDLEPDSPNVIGPDTQWSLPLSPTMIFKDDQLLLAIGTPGAFGIPHTTTQMISNVLDHQFGVQAAIEAPRFRLFEGRRLAVEERISAEVRDELARRGHQIELLEPYSAGVGGGQGILIDPDTGALSGGADPRRDGYAIGF